MSVVVFAGGDPPRAEIVAQLPEERFVIAADSGHDHALALGVAVDLIVGDLDSADLAAVERAVAAGVELREHPRDKDATDLELALALAAEIATAEVLVVGGHGGRVDHFLGNALALTAPALAPLRVRAHLGDALVTVVRSEETLHGDPGELCSLLAVGGAARGVTTRGLRFPLERGVLAPGSSLGMSNELLGTTATVSLTDGVLLAVQPQRRYP